MNGLSHRRSSELTEEEQEHVRAVLRVLRVRLGTRRSVERALPLSHDVMLGVAAGRRTVTPMVAFRVARAFDAPIGAVLTGAALPPGTCRHCGMPSDG